MSDVDPEIYRLRDLLDTIPSERKGMTVVELVLDGHRADPSRLPGWGLRRCLSTWWIAHEAVDHVSRRWHGGVAVQRRTAR